MEKMTPTTPTTPGRPSKPAKPPAPKYHYKLVTVPGSQAAGKMENALREQLEGFSLSLFSISHGGGTYHVMGDSGTGPLDDVRLKKARAVAAGIKDAWAM